jgi:peptidoglycan-associated lipoprotein
MNANRVKGLAVVFMAAGLLSACQDAGPATTGGGGSTADLHDRPLGDGPAIARTAIDDGIVHVWPQAVADRVFFDTDKAVIREEGRDVLAKWVPFLVSHPKDQLLIEGHSDERGTREYNLALGERRANALKEYLVASGIQASRVQIVSYGKERPAVLGSNNEAYAQNRRAVGIIQ